VVSVHSSDPVEVLRDSMITFTTSVKKNLEMTERELYDNLVK